MSLGFNSAAITRELTINAPPSKVCQVLADFDTVAKWKNALIKGLAARRAGTDEPILGIEA